VTADQQDRKDEESEARHCDVRPPVEQPLLGEGRPRPFVALIGDFGRSLRADYDYDRDHEQPALTPIST
jgi:hypothetical protein